MKVRITEAVGLGDGRTGKPGEVVDLPEKAAWNIISVGRGVEFGSPSPGPLPEERVSTVDVREPVAETRDPQAAAPVRPRGNRRE